MNKKTKNKKEILMELATLFYSIGACLQLGGSARAFKTFFFDEGVHEKSLDNIIVIVIGLALTNLAEEIEYRNREINPYTTLRIYNTSKLK